MIHNQYVVIFYDSKDFEVSGEDADTLGCEYGGESGEFENTKSDAIVYARNCINKEKKKGASTTALIYDNMNRGKSLVLN